MLIISSKKLSLETRRRKATYDLKYRGPRWHPGSVHQFNPNSRNRNLKANSRNSNLNTISRNSNLDTHSRNKSPRFETLILFLLLHIEFSRSRRPEGTRPAGKKIKKQVEGSLYLRTSTALLTLRELLLESPIDDVSEAAFLPRSRTRDLRRIDHLRAAGEDPRGVDSTDEDRHQEEKSADGSRSAVPHRRREAEVGGRACGANQRGE